MHARRARSSSVSRRGRFVRPIVPLLSNFRSSSYSASPRRAKQATLCNCEIRSASGPLSFGLFLTERGRKVKTGNACPTSTVQLRSAFSSDAAPKRRAVMPRRGFRFAAPPCLSSSNSIGCQQSTTPLHHLIVVDP